MAKQEFSWKDPRVFWGLFFWGVIILWVITSPLRENCASAQQELKEAEERMGRIALEGQDQGLQQAQAVKVYDLEKKRDRLCQQKSPR